MHRPTRSEPMPAPTPAAAPPATQAAAGRVRDVAPRRLGWIVALWVAWWAGWRRRQGHYDRLTLRSLAWAARAGGGPGLLLRWLSFRRDLGWPLPRRWQAAVAALARAPDAHAVADQAAAGLGAGWHGGRQRQATTLLTETAPNLWPQRVSAPAGPAGMAAQRAEFFAWLAQQGASAGPGPALCVVGNAASLAGRALGSRIDGHAVVFRFNRWWSKAEGLAARQRREADQGRRLDVWVCAPNPAVPPPTRPAWVVVSGPDPQLGLARWPVLQALVAQGVPVVTVPLTVWRDLVAAFQAPPSAGALLLAWLAAGQPGPAARAAAAADPIEPPIATAGVGTGRATNGRQHQVLSNRQTGSRHDWLAEAEWVRRGQGHSWMALDAAKPAEGAVQGPPPGSVDAGR